MGARVRRFCTYLVFEDGVYGEDGWVVCVPWRCVVGGSFRHRIRRTTRSRSRRLESWLVHSSWVM